MAKILVSGGNSRLATCFKRFYPTQIALLTKAQCDITNKTQLKKVIKNFKAKYILNCAAETNIERCEKNPTSCFELNTLAVYQLDQMCSKYNRKLLHISSDYAIKPVNVYGWTKYLSEKLLSPKNLIIRTSFYSSDTYIINELLQEKPISTYKNVYFNPVSINRLVKEIYKNRSATGLINVFSSPRISKYQFALKVCKIFGINNKLVKAIKYANKSGFALRPLESFIKPDIKVSIDEDLVEFKEFLKLTTKIR